MKILIVDDETVEREGISRLIKYFGFNLEIDMAQNGEEALEKCGNNMYDIILTDIKMPRMNGITFLRELQNMQMMPACIIYSAYGEFEYARSAISLGVLEYLLKPIELDKFKEVFERVIQICLEKEEKVQQEQKRQDELKELHHIRMKRELLRFLDSEILESNVGLACQETFAERDYIPIFISESTTFFSARWEDCELIIRELIGENAFLVNVDDETVFVLAGWRGKDKLQKKLEELVKMFKDRYGKDVLVIVGGKCKNLQELREEYMRMKNQLDYRFFTNDGTILIKDDFVFMRENVTIPKILRKIEKSAKVRDFINIKEGFREIFSFIEENTGFSSIYVKSITADALKLVGENMEVSVWGIGNIERLFACRNMQELADMVYVMIDKIREENTEWMKESHLTKCVKELICEKYSDINLSVSMLAQELDVSIGYVSTTFKTDTGQNLSKYITLVRMNKAKELLLDSNLKVNTISLRVGYINTSYFISIFRSNVGCSPIQYRNSKGEVL